MLKRQQWAAQQEPFSAIGARCGAAPVGAVCLVLHFESI